MFVKEINYGVKPDNLPYKMVKFKLHSVIALTLSLVS
jgi:hypothetical protein